MNDAVKRIVERFELVPHPEGGYFREIYRSPMTLKHPNISAGENSERAAGTLIYFLLSGDDFSAFHRVQHSDEIWHMYGGGPIEIFTIDSNGQLGQHTLTTDLMNGEPTVVVPADTWQSARLAPGAEWALGGCTVSPGFQYEDFEMPAASELIGRFPQHEQTIRMLTRR
jgi:predicted cupin superfamily sugar epimerase